MFLKSIEIKGFKSFADKIELKFKKGITVVVGPNGSGKSNISDAVRWVLGEQSIKNLRGEKMEDVIFAGTQFRKPLSLAQVILTFDNSDHKLPIDYSDISISRRLYRSGESQYFINNSQCRLKDIQELFFDTGIGKEGYSIISQGKIDAILSGKPEERRNVIEEASGIVRYKTRKEESEKKLLNTNENLVRINDIVNTYKERIGPLEFENNKAKQFLELSYELKQKDINVILYSIEKIQKNIQNIELNHKDIQIKIKDLSDEKNELKEKAQDSNDKLEEFEQKVEKKMQSYYDARTLHQTTLSQISIFEEKIQNLDNSIKKDSNNVDNLNLKLDNLKKEIANKISEFHSHEGSYKDLSVKVANYIKSLNDLNISISEDDKKIKELEDFKSSFQLKVQNLKNSVALLKNNIQINKTKAAENAANNKNYKNSLKSTADAKILLENKRHSIDCILNKFKSEIDSKNAELNRLNGCLSNIMDEISAVRSKKDKTEAKKSILDNLEKQYEGYNKSVRILMNHIHQNKLPFALNNCFVLGDIISTQKDFEIAIEIALGSAVSDIITTNQETAKRLIDYLKFNNLGRATFLPIDILSPKETFLNEGIRSIHGFIGIANKLVQYDKKFSKAVDFVLGKTLIASDMNSALKISKMVNYRLRVVTLGGDVVNTGGSLTGGSVFHKSSNIISRKREIVELLSSISEYDVKIKKLNSELCNINQTIKNINDEIHKLTNDIHEKSIEMAKIEEKIAALNREFQKLNEDIKKSSEEIQNVEDKIDMDKIKLKDEENKINEITQNEKSNENKVNESRSALEEKKHQIHEIENKLTNYKVEKAREGEFINNIKREVERLKNDIKESNNNINLLKADIENNNNNKKVLKINIDAAKNKVENIVCEISKTEESFKLNKMRKAELKENIKVNTERFEYISQTLAKAREESHKIEISKAKSQSECDAFYSRLNTEFNLTYAEAFKLKEDKIDISEYKKNVTDLKAEISSLGTVNVGAIEEYKNVKEKYTFLSNQRDDLISSRDELIKMIEELTDKIKVIFNENFKKLKIYFDMTFKELFGGGSADLTLAGDDVLSSNIEISVQPPGKKLQNINLMSGGEKVLSAIALLFAILRMKPAPFCFLDEIEAALDDANVLRYAQFLKKFSSKVQFIVITHRKGIMQASDILYGVTMEEKGISKIVSLNLTN